MLRRALVSFALVGALLTGCSDDNSGDAAPRSSSTTVAPTSSTTAPTTTTDPATDGTATTTTVLDPELGCLRAALSDRPELLAALDAKDPKAPDLMRALVVARDCLDDAQLGAALVEGLRGSLTVEVSDFQAECLADQLLALPDADLEALLAGGDEDPTAKRLAARVLSLCQVEG